MKRITAIIVLAVLLLAGCAGQAMTWQQQYDLGIRYLNESNYEEAILAFTQAIEIDPKNVDGYLGRAEAYLGADGEENRALAIADYLTAADICVEQGDSERAEKILNDAQEAVGEEADISDKLYEINGKRPISKLENEYYNNGALMVEYVYDGDGLLIKEIRYDEGGSVIQYYTYEEHDENGMPRRCNHYYADSEELRGYDIREYDENGFLKKKSNYSTDGTQEEYYTYEYDENGNHTARNTYSAEGVLWFRDEYDENGNLINEYRYNTDGSGSIEYLYISEYDENGNVVKHSNYEGGSNLLYYYVYEHDENGDLLKYTEYDGNDTVLYYYTYEYDENGNRIKESMYDSNDILVREG